MCPGNQRVSGKTNDQYQSLFVFDNDHPAFSDAAPTTLAPADGIYQNAPASGITRVMCYSPNHSQSFAELDTDQFVAVLDLWASETDSLLSRPDVEQVLIFENKGEVIGVSNPHPHCQIYAGGFEFKNLAMERVAQAQHLKETGRHLMQEIIESEQVSGSRIVHENETALSFLPYFSRFPYESFIVPKRRHRFLSELSEVERQGLAESLQQMLIRYDNLWEIPFPYMLVLHQAVSDPEAADGYHCHIQIHPLMRQPTLQKYLAGVETGGGHFLNDVDPDQAAEQLRRVPNAHYLSQSTH